MRPMSISRSIRNSDADTNPLTQPSPDILNRTTPPPTAGQDLENQQESSSCGTKFGKFFAYLVLAIVAAIVIAALGVLTLPVSVALLLVFLITYSVITITPFTRHQRDNEQYKEFIARLVLSTITVAILLLVALIVLFIVFRVHSSLKHRTIAGLETWKWLEIALVSCVFCNIWIGGRFILTRVQEEYDYKEDLVYFTSKLRRAINCICFIVGELLVLKVAPTSKKSVIILGLALWKWVLVVVSLICGWYLIRVTTLLLVISLEAWQNKFWKERLDGKKEEDGKKSTNKRHTVKKYAVFMAKGLRSRINILLFFLLIVLTWIFYIKTRLELENLSEDAKKAVKFVIRTFLSLLIAAVLLVIKKFLLLLWEARELYKRFTERIIGRYMQLYFLAKISDAGWEMFNIWAKTADGQEGDHLISTPHEDYVDRISIVSTTDQHFESPRSVISGDRHVLRQGSVRSTGDRSAAPAGDGWKNTTDNQGKQKDDQNMKEKIEKKKKRMEEDANFKLQQILDAAIGKYVSYDILKRIAKLFLDSEDALATYKVEELGQKWEEHHRPLGNSAMNEDKLVTSIRDVYKCQLDNAAATCLYRQLEADLESERDVVEYKDFGNWMKKAHKNCTQLGNTLAGAQEAVAYLNKIMIGFLIAVFIVIWLFLTNIATAEFIVLLTSPLLAAAFIFGDTAKTVFQGIIFAFAVHPFDVGDICVIQGNQLEVKKIGIWKTTFYKNGNKDEEVMYPNSTLIGTSIVKHKDNLDLHDSIEFNVQFGLSDYDTEDEAINTLMKKIKEHLDDSSYFESGINDVMVKEIDEIVKMEVQFKHKKNVQHMTYSECLQKKNENRSKFLQEIRKLIDVVRRQYKPENTAHRDDN